MSWDTATPQEVIESILAVRDRIREDASKVTSWDVARHIDYKHSVGELKSETALKMLTALEQGAEPDYRKLYLAAVRVPLTPKAYHTAPAEFRAQIAAQGLLMALPSDGKWNINASSQSRAVYLGPEPDEIGKFALTEAWDVWEVDTNGLTWEHDKMNEGCWAVLMDIPVEKIRLYLCADRINGVQRV